MYENGYEVNPVRDLSLNGVNEGTLEVPEEVSGEGKALEQTVKKAGALLSPEGIIMLPFAILLDIAGVLFTILDIAYGIGEIPSWISDGIGIIFLGLWILIRSQTMARPKELAEKVVEKRRAIKGAVKAARKTGRGLKFAISVIGEIFPLVGAIPFWTWMVWSELRGEN